MAVGIDETCGNRIFSPSEMRSVLAHKTILFNGDSLTRRLHNTIDLMSRITNAGFKKIDRAYLKRGWHKSYYTTISDQTIRLDYHWNVGSTMCKLKRHRDTSYTHVVLGFGLHQSLTNRRPFVHLTCLKELICDTCSMRVVTFWRTAPAVLTTNISTIYDLQKVNNIVRAALFHNNRNEQNFDNFDITLQGKPRKQLTEMGIDDANISEFGCHIRHCCKDKGSVLYFIDTERLLETRSVTPNRIVGDTSQHFGDAARIAISHVLINALQWTDKNTT